MMQEGMWEDLKMTGSTLRCKSWNAVNLMPVVAERQLSHVGMPLPTYRNQVAFFDMFGEENGSTNFNIAVTGTSGAGKSFLTQGILRDVLNAGGYAWVIDMGTVTRTTVTRPVASTSMARSYALTRLPTSKISISPPKGLCVC